LLPVIVYMHGGGWILGNAETHDRLVRELAVGARAALAFVEYPNAPEAQYPTQIEQGYVTGQWITRKGASKGLDSSRIAVAGESVGGSGAHGACERQVQPCGSVRRGAIFLTVAGFRHAGQRMFAPTA
jgi:acetyl esterase